MRSCYMMMMMMMMMMMEMDLVVSGPPFLISVIEFIIYPQPKLRDFEGIPLLFTTIWGDLGGLVSIIFHHFSSVSLAVS